MKVVKMTASRHVAERWYCQLENGETLMVYHRRRYDMKDSNARFLCIDKMEFDGEKIKPVIMT